MKQIECINNKMYLCLNSRRMLGMFMNQSIVSVANLSPILHFLSITELIDASLYLFLQKVALTRMDKIYLPAPIYGEFGYELALFNGMWIDVTV